MKKFHVAILFVILFSQTLAYGITEPGTIDCTRNLPTEPSSFNENDAERRAEYNSLESYDEDIEASEESLRIFFRSFN